MSAHGHAWVVRATEAMPKDALEGVLFGMSKAPLEQRTKSKASLYTSMPGQFARKRNAWKDLDAMQARKLRSNLLRQAGKFCEGAARGDFTNSISF